MRISIKCKCGRELKTSTVYDTVICEDCGAENVIEKDNECAGCKDYFSGADRRGMVNKGRGLCDKSQ